MKSLKFQIILVSGLLLCILTTLVWLSVRRSFEELFNKWNIFYEDLVTARHKIENNDISKEEWIYTATLNINCEFDLRNITFAIQQMVEKVLYLNNVLRPNIIKLCEYAGLERALVGNAIASGEPISNETQKARVSASW